MAMEEGRNGPSAEFDRRECTLATLVMRTLDRPKSVSRYALFVGCRVNRNIRYNSSVADITRISLPKQLALLEVSPSHWTNRSPVATTCFLMNLSETNFKVLCQDRRQNLLLCLDTDILFRNSDLGFRFEDLAFSLCLRPKSPFLRGWP